MNEQPETRQNQLEEIKKTTAVKFDIITSKWINLCAETLSLDRLEAEMSSFKSEISVDDIRGALLQGQTYMATELKKVVNEEVEKMQLVEKMNKFDELIQEAKKRPPVKERFVPTPEQVMRGVICKAKAKEAEKLRVEYERIKNENTILLKRYASLKNQVNEKQEHLRKDLEKYSEAIYISNSINEDELIDTMDKMDLLN